MPAASVWQSGSRNVVVEHPRRDQLRAAYPLIRLAEPQVDLRAWLRFAEPLVRGTGNRHGIVTARYNGQPHPSGLCCFRREPDLRHGRVLTAEHLVAFDLLDPGPLLTALLGELQALAERLSCGAIRVTVTPDDKNWAAQWPVSSRVLVLRCPTGMRAGGTKAHPAGVPPW